mmetsp:Transcript_6768/g.9978  ORF Transcript_6768/g.9978 Transcript_6768/m.9978 type:complete len:159 (+) Transcript_6768:3-479(+)
MDLLSFYTYGFLIYVPLSLVVALVAHFSSSAESKKPSKTAEHKKPKKQKKQKKPKKRIPPGKVAFCKYCERYLDEEDKLTTHERGKKHLKNTEGRGGEHYKYVDIAEMKKHLNQPSEPLLKQQQQPQQTKKQPLKKNEDDISEQELEKFAFAVSRPKR